jgi:iron complex outermembrane receptor protein
LYGPNSSRGALNLLTRSPLDDTGTDISVAGGERSTFQGAFRHATALSDRVGVKVSGEYFRGNDWPQPLADAGLAERADAIAGGADPDTLLLGRAIDNDERIRGDIRVEFRPDSRTTVVLAGGLAQATVFDPVSFSGVEAALDGARMWFLQGRVDRGPLRVNLFYNKNDFGNAWFPAIGLPLRDYSSSTWGQIQHAVTLGSRQTFIYGGEIGRTVGNSEGTLLGGNEDIADLTELGAFLTSSTRVTGDVEILAAARFDYNSVIGNSAVSPWLSAIYRPTPSHAVRLAVSRSFSTSGVQVWFSDFAVAPVGPLPYSVRVGPSFEKQTFRRDCGGLCMRSPFNPASAGGAAEYLPIDATTQWDAVVGLLQAQGTDISGLPAPTSSDVSSILATLDLQAGFQPTAASEVVDLPARERLWTNAFEIGYKALIGNRVRGGVDLWVHNSSPLSTPAVILTPNVFFDRTSLESYLGRFLPDAQAAALTDAIAGIPVGTVTPEQQNHPTDLQRGSRVGGEVTYWGMDFDLTVAITPELSTTATYSWVSEDSIVTAVLQNEYVFNNPKSRASLALDYGNARVGFHAGLRGRHVQSYPALNGAQRGRLDAYTLVDALVGYRIPGTNVTLTITAYNLFDDVHQELPGTALIGRHVLGGLRATF